MNKDDFGNRMKMYEKGFTGEESTWTLPTPQIVSSYDPIFVRLDGKAFHTWTKKLNFPKPFDKYLSKSFQVATKATCEEIGQVIMAYSQSDEITFLLNGWQNENSQVYFGGKIQKIVSVISSIFTANFMSCGGYIIDPFPYFDARVWNVPLNEIENVFIWRQMDAKRNSIQGLARSLYSHKELNKKSSQEMLEMTKQKGQDWNDLPALQKWGFVVKKEEYMMACGDGDLMRTNWVADLDIPFFADEREYLTDIINVE